MSRQIVHTCLDALIAQREAERQQVERQLHDVEHELAASPPPRVTLAGSPTSEASHPPAPATRPVTLFYSYAHTDEALRAQLAKHLALLQPQHVISDWHDRMIQAGAVWEPEILTHLETADIILLLVSADFLASDYCWGKEVARAMERQRAGTARVIPILLRAVEWSMAPFHMLQALPRDARPVTSWPNQDEAFADIAQGIRQVALSLRRDSV
jgi:hypothetical protein